LRRCAADAAARGALRDRTAPGLCVDLARRSGIAPDRPPFHGDLPGARTLCPGGHFPRDRTRAGFGAVLAA